VVTLFNAGPSSVKYEVLSAGASVAALSLGSKLETKLLVPSGPIVVELTNASGAHETRELELEAGEETRLEFDLGE